jgi:CTD small phosphatase-like protein 2
MQFLKELAQFFEIVVFTAGVEEYANWVIDQIDEEKLITHRLYRQHACPPETAPLIIKDLSKIGRDLSKTIIVDNIADNFLKQKDNGIFVNTWYDDMEDQELGELIPILKRIVQQKTGDVRTVLR